jgi:hypothetical protein
VAGGSGGPPKRRLRGLASGPVGDPGRSHRESSGTPTMATIGRRALTISIALIVLYLIVGELLLFGDKIGIFDD